MSSKKDRKRARPQLEVSALPSLKRLPAVQSTLAGGATRRQVSSLFSTPAEPPQINKSYCLFSNELPMKVNNSSLMTQDLFEKDKERNVL
jgi:hypothetical protein